MKRRELINNLLLSAAGITLTGVLSCNNNKKPKTVLIVSGYDSAKKRVNQLGDSVKKIYATSAEIILT